MATGGAAEIAKLLVDTTHYDKDNRYMAVSDLMNELAKDIAIDAALERRCVPARQCAATATVPRTRARPPQPVFHAPSACHAKYTALVHSDRVHGRPWASWVRPRAGSARDR